MTALTQLYAEDIRSALLSLRSIANWAVKRRPAGSIELRYHRLYLPDSILVVETEKDKVIFWDLSFGRDLTHKRVMVLRPAPGNLGQNILERYSLIWDSADCMFLLQQGAIQADNLH